MNTSCFCDPISGICYLTKQEDKFIKSNFKILSKLKKNLNAFNSNLPIKTPYTVEIIDAEDKIIIKNLIAFRGDFEQKNGIVYD